MHKKILPWIILLSAWLSCFSVWGTPSPVEGDRRYIVQFSQASLIDAIMKKNWPGARHGNGKINFESDRVKTYLGRLDSLHGDFSKQFSAAFPGGKIQHRYRILFFGMTVTGVEKERLASLEGVVRVYPADTIIFRPYMDASLPMINSDFMWSELGGSSFAGQGIKIAVIDSGIDIYNPMFDPAGFTFPAGYPKGETAFTTEKVIASRAYFRTGDPVNTDRDTEDPVDHGGHGSHCAGIAAGNINTTADYNGSLIPVSGVAPGAWLMNYKVFYRAQSGSDGAFEPELMAAMEDAVADGADVISCSWGGSAIMIDESPSTQVYEGAIEAGAVVVFAAGNEGDGPGTIGYPGTIAGPVTVGNLHTGRAFAGLLNILGPGAVPASLVGVPAIKGSISPDFTGAPIGPVSLISAKTTADAVGVSPDGCDPYPPGSFTGAAVLIRTLQRFSHFRRTSITFDALLPAGKMRPPRSFLTVKPCV